VLRAVMKQRASGSGGAEAAPTGPAEEPPSPEMYR
jgi:hypothetical protein